MEFIVVFLSTLVAGYVLVGRRKYNKKQASVKKEEIILSYENKLKNILDKTDDENKVQEKTNFLKSCNDELSRNIYFDKDEIKDILANLAKL